MKKAMFMILINLCGYKEGKLGFLACSITKWKRNKNG
jgi:hypothetical protein